MFPLNPGVQRYGATMKCHLSSSVVAACGGGGAGAVVVCSWTVRSVGPCATADMQNNRPKVIPARTAKHALRHKFIASPCVWQLPGGFCMVVQRSRKSRLLIAPTDCTL